MLSIVVDRNPAPFGLRLLVQEATNAAGVKPAATDPHALAIWRTHLTDAIMATITPA